MEDPDADASNHPEVSEDHVLPFIGNRDEGHTQKTPEYVRTMVLDIKNID